MSVWRPKSWMRWARRLSQVVFLAAFCWLLWNTRVQTPEPPAGLLHLFFDLDPLVLLGTWLTTHTLSAVSLLGLITVAVTLVLGRVFCGWFCPLGTINHACGWVAERLRRRPIARPGGPSARDGYSRWQGAKYLLLAGLVAMALFGGHWLGVFDPFSVLYRSMGTAILPAAQYGIEDASTAVFQADPRIGGFRLTSVTEPIYKFFRAHVFVTKRQTFDGGPLIFALFMAIALLNATRKRFWCRYICPLGGLLGVLARRPAMRLKNEAARCTQCGRCSLACPAGADPEAVQGWHSTECYACWNCVAACNAKALRFGWAPPLRKATDAKLDLSKRAVLAAGLGGVGSLLMARVAPEAQAVAYNPGLVRPPGALAERAFLQRCIQCGLCMKVCPTNAIQPAFTEAGLEGLWTPMLEPRVGYCEYECNRCGQVCPTQALKALPIDEKKQFKMGLASFDTTRCLPHAYKRNCLICEEHCPIPTKAIYFIESEVKLRDGSTTALKLPFVDPDLCIGCGICETKCVFNDRPAIRVSSANETRHPGNRAILQGLPGLPPPKAAPSSTAPSSANPYGGASSSSSSANPYG